MTLSRRLVAQLLGIANAKLHVAFAQFCAQRIFQRLAQLQKMCGWNEPEKLELSSDTLSHYLLELRKQPFFGGPVIDLENGSPAELTTGQKDRG